MNPAQRLHWFLKGTTLDAKRARRIAKVILLIALFVGVFWVIPINKVVDALLEADPFFLIIGLILALLAVSLTAAQLKPLVQQQGITHGVGQILAINLAAKFYSMFAPGTIVAGGFKWYRLSQPGGKVAEAFAALAFFRLLRTFLSIVLGLCFWLLSDQDIIQISVGWLIILLIGIIMSWIVITRLSVIFHRWFRARSEHLDQRPVLHSFFGYIEKLFGAIATYSDMPLWGLFAAVFIGIVSQLVGVLGNLFMARSVGIGLSYLELGWIYTVVDIATQLPFAVAGGIGIREVTLVAILPTFGIGAETALAYSFLLFVKGIFLGLVGGLLEWGQTLNLRRMK